MDLVLATSDVYMTERGDPTTDIGNAVVGGDIVVKTSDGINYTVNGTSYTATEPVRTDGDGDGYFVEVDPDDGSATSQPAPQGGCDETYQYCSIQQVDPPTITEAKPGKKSVTIYWDDTQTADAYYIFRSETSGGPYVFAANLDGVETSWKNTGLTSGVTYYFAMKAVINGIESGYSNEVSATAR
jgi:hypothetical protein